MRLLFYGECMKKILVSMMCVLSLQLGLAENVQHLQSPQNYHEMIQDHTIQLVDVRTAEEFNAGTIGHAKNIDYLSSEFIEGLNVLNKDEPVYIFCRSGNRSQKARQIMLEHGFTQVYDLDGGYNAWTLWETTKEQE